jgi:hypothetical protein
MASAQNLGDEQQKGNSCGGLLWRLSGDYSPAGWKVNSHNIRFPPPWEWLMIRGRAAVRADRLKPKLLVIELWGLGDLASRG